MQHHQVLLILVQHFFSTFSVKVAKDSFLLATLNEITGKALKFTRETLGSLTPSGSFTFVRASLISVSAFPYFYQNRILLE